MREGQAEAAESSLLCSKVPKQLRPALLATSGKVRVGAVAVGSELAHPQTEGFLGGDLLLPHSSLHYLSTSLE